MTKYLTLQITPDKAEEILLRLYGINGKASSLPGEIDFNFRIKTENGDGYILKISRPDEDIDYLNYQQQLLEYVALNDKNLIAPKIIRDKQGNIISEIVDDTNTPRKIRLLSWVSGRIWSSVNPQLNSLRHSLGEQCGLLTNALQGFDHPKAHRIFAWDIAQSLWTTKHLNLFKGEEKNIILFFQDKFTSIQDSYSKLRKAVVHNDANDNNVIVSEDLIHPKVQAAIDYGDAIYTQIINDLAVTCAYAIMNHNDPLEASLPIIQGYHSTFPLKEDELKHLYIAIAMRLVTSVTKSAINKINEPDNEYLLISEKPAWKVLKKWVEIDEEYAYYSFRNICRYRTHPHEEAFRIWAKNNNYSLSELFPTVQKHDIQLLDLSISSTWIGHQEEFNDLDIFQFKIDRLQKENPNKIIAGGYLEPRALYTSDSYDKIGNNGRESRTVHLGIDFWLPASTPVHALLDGEVVTSFNDTGDKNYGGLIIVKHKQESIEFYTLYGHLTKDSILQKQPGEIIKKGECIGFLGDPSQNGNWAPHLHFQIMLSTLSYTVDFPGVAYYNQIEVWKGLCPDPNLLFKLKKLNSQETITNEELISYRKKHLGKSLSLQYKVPIKMVRGAGQYLIDQYGRKYLDTVNNVAHVGHENYNVVRAGQEQMALINTNSRYLHDNINQLTKELLETLPSELNVVHFVNSGSEANELAIRMVKAATGERDIIASEIGYHGNANMCIDISSYKFDGKGGHGAPEHTHVFPLPDAYRGKYRGKNTGDKYAFEVQKCLETIRKKGRKVGAFIVEPIISCGGQIELPEGFLNKAYKYTRAEGGLCISDEVQVGCGRVGKAFWGFQLYDVIPDIVTIGKPLGNGHPLAAVVCTQEVADKFANGMEYFNTFGGNPVSSAIGTAVLKVVKDKNLQQHALKVGEFLKEELKRLALKYPIIGDVRGQGLFLGFELVDKNTQPLPGYADYLANRIKDYGILMSIDGPDHNVLKIKPPIIFTTENAKELIFYLNKIFNEDYMKNY
ncbi:aminotransferase class III-fold pyridoxal phosphate-dependent enzyme [Aquimarina sediminis]|uniref:aminotransferase class III-fold pyridoxal phosphate-dependent enzyme n=1 Tax=Aquimarina sediminis TaxID=2070536 RepID=UPI000CA05232|nr:aminotransferase class III-fold pyridoxal phosphate-dependent enzyme [Aquimarina sediminis]